MSARLKMLFATIGAIAAISPGVAWLFYHAFIAEEAYSITRDLAAAYQKLTILVAGQEQRLNEMEKDHQRYEVSIVQRRKKDED